MAKSVIITCPVTGSIHTPTMSEHQPISPNEIAEGAIAALVGLAVKQAQFERKLVFSNVIY